MCDIWPFLSHVSCLVTNSKLSRTHRVRWWGYRPQRVVRHRELSLFVASQPIFAVINFVSFSHIFSLRRFIQVYIKNAERFFWKKNSEVTKVNMWKRFEASVASSFADFVSKRLTSREFGLEAWSDGCVVASQAMLVLPGVFWWAPKWPTILLMLQKSG